MFSGYALRSSASATAKLQQQLVYQKGMIVPTLQLGIGSILMLSIACRELLVSAEQPRSSHSTSLTALHFIRHPGYCTLYSERRHLHTAVLPRQSFLVQYL